MADKVKVGINGFGRIGRISLRASLLPSSTVEITQINDPFMTLGAMATLLNFDSAHNRFVHKAVANEPNSSLDIYAGVNQSPYNDCEGNLQKIASIKVTYEKSPSSIPWTCSVVVDCTGVFLTKELASQHLAPTNQLSKAKRVVLSAPPKSSDVPMFVMGVNHTLFNSSTEQGSGKKVEVVSNASCTTNCLAPLVKAVHERFGLNSGLMTTVHAVTASQPIVDGPNKKSLRMGFSGCSNIVPTTTGAAKAVGAVLPEVKGKLTGMAFRVPTTDVSVVDLTVTLKKNVSLEEVLAGIKEASQKELKGILKYDESDSLTSAAIKGDEHSSIFDAKASMEMVGHDGKRLIKLVAWYDNEFGYSCRLMQLAGFVGSN